MNFLETSAKNKINIEESFKTLTLAILPTAQAQAPSKDKRDNPMSITRKENKPKEGCQC